MRRDVAANSVAEDAFAQKTFQHPQKRLAFAVSDVVERAVCFRFVGDGLLNRVSCRCCVAFHGNFFGDSRAACRVPLNIFRKPDFPIRIEMRTAFAAHPGREPFVKPKIIPPRHCHQVAEPLVRCLVRDHFVNALARGGGRFLWIEKQRRFVVSDAAPILHRAAKAARNRDLIELRKRITNAEVIVVVLKNLRRAFERVSAPFRFSFRRNDSDLRAGNFGFDRLELAGDEHVQVTGHRRSRLEANFLADFDLMFEFDGHVRNSEPILRDDSRHLKARAKTWLVPAREKPPRIAWFELSPESYFFCTGALLLIRHVIEAAPFLGDLSVKLERERMFANCQFVRQRDRE